MTDSRSRKRVVDVVLSRQPQDNRRLTARSLEIKPRRAQVFLGTNCACHDVSLLIDAKIRALEQRVEAVLAIEPIRDFETFFDALAAMSETAHLVQMFNSTVVRAHVSAAGAKGGETIRHSAARAAASRRKST